MLWYLKVFKKVLFYFPGFLFCPDHWASKTFIKNWKCPIVAQGVEDMTLSLWGCKFNLRPCSEGWGSDIAASYGVVCRCGLELMLLWLWLWHSPQLWLYLDSWPGFPYAASVAVKRNKTKQNKTKQNKRLRSVSNITAASVLTWGKPPLTSRGKRHRGVLCERQSTNKQPRLRRQSMQPGGYAVLRKRCLYLKKNMASLEVISWLYSNKKCPSLMGQRCIKFSVALHNGSKHFFSGKDQWPQFK